VGAVAATLGDAPELLDVQVDQLARVLTLIAHDHAAAPVEVGEATQAMTAQYPVDGRAGQVQLPGEAVGALAVAAPSRQHPTHLGGREGMGQWCGRELRSASPARPWAR